MLVEQLLRVAEIGRFVGRTDELQALTAILSSNRPEWTNIRLHGPSGIGKTALLKRFETTQDAATLCLYADCSGFGSAEELFFELGVQLSRNGFGDEPDIPGKSSGVKLADTINRIGNTGKRSVVLLLDAVEEDEPLARELRSWYLLLDSRIAVVTAGTTAANASSSGVWHRLQQRIRLSPLSYEEQAAYMRSHHIHDQRLQDAISRFAGGVPMALELAIERIRRGYDQQDLLSLCSILVGHLLRHIDQPLTYKLIEASSLIPEFNQESLSALVEQELSAFDFNAFARLPLIQVTDNGWTLSDPFRTWVALDFQRRKPHAFRTMTDRVNERSPAEKSVVSPVQAPNPPAATRRIVDALGVLLLHYANLANQSETLADFASMFPRLMAENPSAKDSASPFRAALRRAIRGMSEQSDASFALSKLLEQAYMADTRSHARTAERFGYSMATYYRNLKKAKNLLAETLLSMEQEHERERR
ncbi:AAA family ATPase [Cohnella panacarvi]|uniref:AAA family ATPase n=1 Tax=Cohnella panacarvi TaxID=400776 RepID=UPI00047D157F|nr:AAA family ATPase [Cohnella panacarvi]